MDNIKVSIVIPVFNLEKYIGAMLDSCLAQDLPLGEYEIICIDDGSTDGSSAIIADYQRRFSIIRACRTANSGVSHARNIGLSMALGEYVWFVDGDDLIRENCLGKLYSAVKDCEGDILWFRMEPYSEEPPISANNRGEFLSCSRKEDMYQFMFSKGGGGVCVHFFKRSFLAERGIHFHEDIRYSEDVLFGFECIMSASVCVKTQKVCYFYRQHSGSAMHMVNHRAHMESMERLAFAYNSMLLKEQETSRKSIIRNKRDFAVRALLFSAMQTGDMDLAKEKLVMLKEASFYPYPLKREMLIGNETFKQLAINLSSFLFPISGYFLLCVWVCHIRKQLSR